MTDEAVEVFDDRQNTLGEGALWHPLRGELFWVDILNSLLRSRKGSYETERRLEQAASALGWVDENHLLLAQVTGLSILNLETDTIEVIAPFDAEAEDQRPNDGRADPWGGFWISTMSMTAEPGKGRIYRYYKGELRLLIVGLTIPNALCFQPDRSRVYYADSLAKTIKTMTLDEEGWPFGTPEVFVQNEESDGGPDGAVIDADGRMWNAEWGTAKLVVYGRDGTRQQVIKVPAKQPTCPAFGPPGSNQIFFTSATEGLGKRGEAPNGQTFVVEADLRPQPEPAVKVKLENLATS